MPSWTSRRVGEPARWRAAVAVIASSLASLGAVACGSGVEGEAATGRAQELRVFAASSLRAAFGAAEEAYERSHPDVDVVVTFGGSPSLARQIDDGAPADVVAAADEASIAPLVASGRLGPPTAFAANRLTVVVERGNPRGIDDLADLGDPAVLTVLCAPEVPCGRLASRWLAGASVEVEPASLEASVDGVVAKVALGEADAGIVYVTDATAAAGVERAAVPQDTAAEGEALQARYVVAEVLPHRSPSTRRDADRWVAFLRSGAGRTVLERAGFGLP